MVSTKLPVRRCRSQTPCWEWASRRPAVHGVVVRAGFGDLNLAGDGGVFPGDLRGGTVGDIDGLELLIHDIALILQLPQVVAAGAGQVVDVDIAAVIRSVLPDGVFIAVIEQEGHTIDTLTGVRVDLVDQDAAECLVGHRQGDGLAVLHLEIVGCGIHLEALCRLGLHGVVGTILQRDKDAAILAGGPRCR